jgi:hypothetical protein
VIGYARAEQSRGQKPSALEREVQFKERGKKEKKKKIKIQSDCPWTFIPGTRCVWGLGPFYKGNKYAMSSQKANREEGKGKVTGPGQSTPQCKSQRQQQFEKPRPF